MKILSVLLLLIFTQLAFSQATNPNDTFKIGSSSSSDKGLIFETGDGASNKKLTVEKATKMMKFDGNSFQLGDGALTQDKKIIFNGTSGAYLMYDKTNLEVSTNSNVAIDAGKKLKTNSIDTKSGTEVAIEQNARVKGNLNLGTGNNQLRVNAGNLEFSNDGSLYKKIGSGGGGGSGGSPINTNGSFEDGVSTGWTSSGGTFAQASYTGTPPDSDLKYASFIATGAGQYFETSLFTTPQFMVGGCLGKLDYYSTDASGTWKVQILDSASNLLKETVLDPKNWQSGYAGLPCPPVGTQIKLKVISTAAGTILSDRVELGKESRTFQVAQAKVAGASYFPATSGCVPTRGSTTQGPLTGMAACPAPTITESSMGVWQTTDADNIKQTISNLPAGKYEATFEIWQYISSSSDVNLSIFDGATSCATVPGQPTTSAAQVKISCIFTYTTAGSHTFEIYASSTANTVNVRADTVNAKFTLKSWPTDSDTALRPDTQDWFVDVNIGGADASLGVSSVSSYAEITNASLDMVPSSGSAGAKIPCSSTNASTGSTCSAGNEGVGIVFTNPTAGYYKVCAYFSHFISIGSATSLESAFELVETSPSSQTILQEGGARLTSGLNNGGSVLMNPTHPYSLCGKFYFSSVTERTIRLMYEQLISGTNSVTSSVRGDRSGSLGQRDIRITVEPTLYSSSRPYLVGDQLIRKFSSDLATFSFSSSFTTSTLANAPIGTYIAFTGGASAQCTTQMATSPTNQTDAQKSTDGILLVSKVFTVASTAGIPCRYDIQIGKNLKGYKVDAYTGAAKTGSSLSLDFFVNGSNIDIGVYQSYNETTGVLTINSGYAWSSNTTRWLGTLTDGTTSTTGYFIINAWGL